MKNLKRILIITVMTFILVTRTAYGIEPLALNLESFNYDDGAMKIFFNTSYDQELKPEQLTLSIGNKKMGVSDLKRVEFAEAGVTYLFLVDVSRIRWTGLLRKTTHAFLALAMMLTQILLYPPKANISHRLMP